MCGGGGAGVRVSVTERYIVVGVVLWFWRDNNYADWVAHLRVT